MLETINLTLEPDYKRRFRKIADKNYTDCSKLLRKWIDENWKKEYEED